MLCVLFCHPFGAGSLLFLSQGLHPWLYPFSPSGLLWGAPFMVCIQTVARLKPCPTHKFVLQSVKFLFFCVFFMFPFT